MVEVGDSYFQNYGMGQLIQDILNFSPFPPFLYYYTGTQVNQDETTKEEVSSAILMTGKLKCRKDFELIKAEKESSIDGTVLSLEVTESTKLNKSTLLHHPTGASSNADLDQSNLHPAGVLPPVPDLPLPLESLQVPLITKFEKGWNMTYELLRPRIFCLEHAVKIKELLQPRGGASMLIICHSGDNF